MTVSVNSNKTVYEDLFPFLPAAVEQVKYAQQPMSYRYFLRAYYSQYLGTSCHSIDVVF